MNSQLITTKQQSIDFKLDIAGHLANYSDNSKKMVKSSLNVLSEFLKENNMNLGDLNQNIINVFLEKMRKSGMSNASYNAKVSLIKNFLDHIGLTFKYKTLKKQPFENVRLISIDMLSNYIEWLRMQMTEGSEKKRITYIRDYLLFKLYFLTGHRKMELINLKHHDIQCEGEKYFYKAKLKGYKEAKKEFPNSLIGLLLNLKEREGKDGADYIFTSKIKGEYNRLSHDTINKKMNHYFEKYHCKKIKFTIHGIRNISALKKLEITNDIYAVKEHLNHARIETTDMYLSKVKQKTDSNYEDMEKAITKESLDINT